ncbi:MAG: hypothetical protein WCV62_05835 [Candidatus Peribacteraceae bacterium]
MVEEVIVDPDVLHLFPLLGFQFPHPLHILPAHHRLGPVVFVTLRAPDLLPGFELELPAVSAGATEAPDLHHPTRARAAKRAVHGISDHAFFMARPILFVCLYQFRPYSLYASRTAARRNRFATVALMLAS